MNVLVVYYTRTGNTRQIAEEITDKLNADVEEIIDKTKRSGIIGWLRSGYHAVREKLTEIEEMKKNPQDYDIIILGTPNWAGRLTPAIRTYISRYKDQFNKLAYFITMGGRAGDELIKNIREFCGKKPIATAQILEKEIEEDNYTEKIDAFIREIKVNSE
ncbi:MAG: flavodoxin [Candidatus Lokiarchaeota archaeon]|nr:flavodoxin [Candidatus Lokiarchaeota archaeon]